MSQDTLPGLVIGARQPRVTYSAARRIEEVVAAQAECAASQPEPIL